MAETRELPRFVSGSRVRASSWVTASMALLVGACALTGLYPQFDHGQLRGVVALIAAATTVGVFHVAFGDTSRAGAVMRTLGMATIGGAVVAFLGGAALLIPTEGVRMLPMLAMMSVLFGGPCGFFYGISLAFVTWLTARHHLANTYDGDDRAARVAGVILALGALLLVAYAFRAPDAARLEAIELLATDHRYRLVTQCVDAILVGGGGVSAIAAHLRIRARARWIDAVRAGHEPTFIVRGLAEGDAPETLPRLGARGEVIAWRLPVNAYRSTSSGPPVALV